ncbi:NUDIX domain-containing protein [Phormidium sp. CLA17]|uniref:NUDIX hydrolase n=1 Tax=Leptolyngbya sp. Cla-17 TaxID=2803751 RepID=UPI00149146BC|nr:NUDIX domain-containing protein [Leptolyngbya sp. Cla-17]MBM0744199.1 NUDIX domain-containing protein [Leptolyngbya sp. Cla-17]
MADSAIRAVALGLIFQGDRVFVYEAYDPFRQQVFHRALGGGIEFGETSLEALQREFQEEIQAELTNIQYLACIENIFTYNGNSYHELVQLYSADFVDARFYRLEELIFADGSAENITARWIARDRFLSGELRLVPESCLNYL